MRRRRLLCLLVAVAATFAGCGDDDGGSGFGCTGQVCKVSFQGPGKQDLSSQLGKGATVEVVGIADQTVAVRVAGRDAKLVPGERVSRLGRFDVTLTKVSGDDVDLRVVTR